MTTLSASTLGSSGDDVAIRSEIEDADRNTPLPIRAAEFAARWVRQRCARSVTLEREAGQA